MATRTSVGSGLWSAASTWDTGVPANTDLVVIAAGHTVTFDVDQSAFASGIAGMTIQSGATLVASTSAGNYYLKMAGHIQNSGTIQAGTSAAVRYPSNCTFTIYFNGAYQINNQPTNLGKVYFFCNEPTNRYARMISGSPKPISGISKSSSCTVTCAGHGYVSDTVIYLLNMVGMDELVSCRVRVGTVIDPDNFTINWYDSRVVIDSSLFTQYISGGFACPEIAEAAGQTRIEIDRDVSSDPEWTRSGAEVYLGHNFELRNISSVSAGYVDISVALASSKYSGGYVALTKRNIHIELNGNAVLFLYGTGLVLHCSSKNTTYNSGTFTRSTTDIMVGGAHMHWGQFLNLVSRATVSCVLCHVRNSGDVADSVFTADFVALSLYYANISSSNVYGIFYQPTYLFQGGIGATNIFAEFNGGPYAVNQSRTSGSIGVYGRIINSASTNILSGVFGGKIFGGGITASSCTIYGAWIMGCLVGVSSSHITSINSVFAGNTWDALAVNGKSYNTQYLSTIEYYKSYPYLIGKEILLESNDHDGVAGAFRAWTSGGVTSSTATDPPTGRVRSYQTVCESATYPGWYQREIVVDAGRQLRLRVWLKADAGVEIKAQLVLPTADPLVTGTGTGEWQQIGTSDGTWYEYITSWTNSATYPVTIYARVLSTAASGNGYSDMMWAFDRTPLVR